MHVPGEVAVDALENVLYGNIDFRECTEKLVEVATEKTPSRRPSECPIRPGLYTGLNPTGPRLSSALERRA